MPNFSAVALETLLESAPAKSSYPPTNFSYSLPSKPETNGRRPSKPPHIFISPALYTTPNPTPVPNSSPSSISPSPYVVNRKRRDVPPPELRLNGFHLKEEEHRSRRDGEGLDGGEACLDASLLDAEEGQDDVFGGEIVDENDRESAREREEEGDFFDEFADPCDSASIVGRCDSNGRGSLQRRVWKDMPLSTQSEFYDAPEDFLVDGCNSLQSHSFSSNAETELRAARMNLLEEIEKRKKAEEAHDVMHGQWERIVDCLSRAGISFPMAPESGNTLLEKNAVDQFCQEIITVRFVSEAVGRAQARAEAEASAQVIIDSKNQEISRLQDKLQYYETVNHEMSQRNQEIMEKSRRQRQTRLRRKKWIWSFVGLSTALGASILAYSYFPHSAEQPATTNCGSDTHSST